MVYWHHAVQVGFSNGEFKYYREGTCASGDTKPTNANGAQLAEGSVLVESDTGDVYFFKETADAWGKQFSFKE